MKTVPGGSDFGIMSSYPVNDRKAENDEKILKAAFRILINHGCAELSFSAVASAVGISRRPLIDRFDDISDLKIKVWQNRVGPAFLAWLQDIFASFEIENIKKEPSLFEEIFRTALQPSMELQVALELLIESQFDKKLQDVIQNDLSPHFSSWFETDRTQAGRNGYILMVLVGFLIASRTLEYEDRTDLSIITKDIIERALLNRDPIDLPPDTADYLTIPLEFDLEDKTLIALLHATHEIIGEVGYDHATVDTIVKRANSSQGALFARFPTKLELFIESTRQHSDLAMKRNWEFRMGLDKKYGPGIGACIFVREACRLDWARLRATNIEQYRLTWYNALFRENSNSITARFKKERQQLLAQATTHEDDIERNTNDYYAVALGMGMVFLPLIYPKTSELAFDVMLLGD